MPSLKKRDHTILLLVMIFPLFDLFLEPEKHIDKALFYESFFEFPSSSVPTPLTMEEHKSHNPTYGIIADDLQPSLGMGIQFSSH